MEARVMTVPCLVGTEPFSQLALGDEMSRESGCCWGSHRPTQHSREEKSMSGLGLYVFLSPPPASLGRSVRGPCMLPPHSSPHPL